MMSQIAQSSKLCIVFKIICRIFTNCSIRCSQSTVDTGKPIIQHRIFFRLAGFLEDLRTSNTCRESMSAGKTESAHDSQSLTRVRLERSVFISSQHSITESDMYYNFNDVNDFSENTRMWEDRLSLMAGITTLSFHSCRHFLTKIILIFFNLNNYNWLL
jgi:hypothetical protein